METIALIEQKTIKQRRWGHCIWKFLTSPLGAIVELKFERELLMKL